MNADGGHGFETWYAAALDVVTDAYATWDRAAHGTLTATQLANFQAVVWNADLAYPPLTAGDMAALGAYLDGGGRLFISGQDVGWALCAAGSPYATTESRAWYARYLGADFVADDSGIYSLYGETGDPIGGGLSFAIDGGTGSDSRATRTRSSRARGPSPSSSIPRGARGPSATTTAPSGRLPGLRIPGPGDALEPDDGDEPRAALADRGPGGRAGRVAARLARAGPQSRAVHSGPFASAVPSTAPASLELLDVAGRRLAAEDVGSLAPGPHTLVWEGVLATGVPVRLRQGTDSRVTRRRCRSQPLPGGSEVSTARRGLRDAWWPVAWPGDSSLPTFAPRGPMSPPPARPPPAGAPPRVAVPDWTLRTTDGREVSACTRRSRAGRCWSPSGRCGACPA